MAAEAEAVRAVELEVRVVFGMGITQRAATTMEHLGLKQQYQAADRMAWADDMVLSTAMFQAAAVEVAL